MKGGSKQEEAPKMDDIHKLKLKTESKPGELGLLMPDNPQELGCKYMKLSAAIYHLLQDVSEVIKLKTRTYPPLRELRLRSESDIAKVKDPLLGLEVMTSLLNWLFTHFEDRRFMDRSISLTTIDYEVLLQRSEALNQRLRLENEELKLRLNEFRVDLELLDKERNEQVSEMKSKRKELEEELKQLKEIVGIYQYNDEELKKQMADTTIMLLRSQGQRMNTIRVLEHKLGSLGHQSSTDRVKYRLGTFKALQDIINFVQKHLSSVIRVIKAPVTNNEERRLRQVEVQLVTLSNELDMKHSEVEDKMRRVDSVANVKSDYFDTTTLQRTKRESTVIPTEFSFHSTRHPRLSNVSNANAQEVNLSLIHI
eukprot:TRINITY_DN7646_c0_g3_i1.p1 TRINITY_DN7646_c0_g3~~TRINITY_DN7646_c0_g3_i1.p1  ORF type:complete len:367 (+),score=77.41 TRINITY_DN7646_c0_g3_i1:162-1262(+)